LGGNEEGNPNVANAPVAVNTTRMVEDLCINTLLAVAMEEAMANIGASDDQVSPFSTQQQYPEPHFIAPATEEKQQQQQQKKKKTSSSKRHRTADVDDAPGEANRREYYEWSHGAVHSLLDIYEEKYLALQRGNLRGRHWHEVALHVSAREDGSKSAKTSKQCKMKIENLKRRYKVRRSLLKLSSTPVRGLISGKKSPQRVTYLRVQHHAQPATNVHT
jgi:hypothetical protein